MKNLGWLAAAAGVAGLSIVAASQLLKSKRGYISVAQPGKLMGFRAEILHFVGEPYFDGEKSYEHFADGILVVKDGKVVDCNTYNEITKKYPAMLLQDCRPYMIVPGFLDSHIHFPQIDMIASYGEQLLEWLQKYVFPVEARYKDKKYAQNAAEDFVTELLRCGTTTALVFCTVHRESVDAIFEAAEKRDMLMIAGKVMMDREPFAPPELRMEAAECEKMCQALIEKWHKRGRCLYAVTPRFAVTSTTDQLNRASALLKRNDGLYVHTHMNENTNEIKMVQELHGAKNYLEVYDRAGLTGPRSVFAHCIHMQDEELKVMHDTQSVISFCPTSNLFLGSGLFNIKRIRDCKCRYGLGTDVGAGTNFCQFVTLNEAYKVYQLQHEKLSPLQALYLATLGTSRSLSLDDRVGNFQTGKEADFLLIDQTYAPLIKRRMNQAVSLEERLFILCTMGDERAIAATFIKGLCMYTKP